MSVTPGRALATSLLVLACALAPLGAQGGRDLAAVGTILPPYPEQFAPEDALALNRYSIADLTDDGRSLAVTMTVQRDELGNDERREGDPTYVHPIPVRAWIMDGVSRVRTEIFPDKRAVRALQFSPDGKQLAMLLWTGDLYEPAIYDRSSKKVATLHLPTDRYVAESSDLRWTNDGKSLLVAVHTIAWRKKAQATFKEMTAGPVFVQSSRTPFLIWDQLRRDANARSVGALDVKTGQYHELLPETMLTSYAVADDDSAVTYVEDLAKATSYDGSPQEGRLVTRSVATGTTRTLVASTRGATVVWAADGRHYALARDGQLFAASLDDPAVRLIAGAAAPAAPAAPAADRYDVVRFSPRGDALLVRSLEGMWVIDLATAAKELVIPARDSTGPLDVAVAAWSDDGSKLYFTTSSPIQRERTVVRYDRATKQRVQLAKDTRHYTEFRLSKDGSHLFLTLAEENRPPDLYAANGDLGELHRFVLSNPQMEAKRFGTTELMTFPDADGRQAQAGVLYPPNYQRGRAYPTVFLIGEELFGDAWDMTANILSGAGYVIVTPLGIPDSAVHGDGLMKNVLAAAKTLAALGVTDSTRLGVQGAGDGGYAADLLITQTNHFRAAINIAGVVDLIGFYTGSPRFGARNVAGAEHAMGASASPWAQPQEYLSQSPLMLAERITTPLMLITGGQDPDVPADNSGELFYALRRLGREVVWVDYVNGGHAGGTATPDDFLDMYHRMVGWYDEKLKRRPSPP